MKQTKKYIVVDTWNGEGHSSENGTEIRIFDNKEQASYYCRVEAFKNEEKDVMVVEKVKNGYEYYDISEDGVDDSGSYRYYPLPKDAYAVEILCNINEVRILNQIEFAKAIADREAELQDYLNSTIFDETREDKVIPTDDGIFYHSTNQYDYQYRRLESLYSSRVESVSKDENFTRVYEDMCSKCDEVIEYTDVFSCCPNCLTSF